MIITLSELKNLNMHEEGIDWFKKQETEDARELLARAKGNILALQYWNLFLIQKMTKYQNVQYAVFASEKVIGIYEKQYMDNMHPRKAIDISKAYLSATAEEKQLVAYATYAAKAADAAEDAIIAGATTAASNAAFAAAFTACAALTSDIADAAYAICNDPNASATQIESAYKRACYDEMCAAYSAYDAVNSAYEAYAADVDEDSAHAKMLFDIVSFGFNIVFEKGEKQ